MVLATDDVQSFAFFNYLDDGITWVLGDVNAGVDGLNTELISMDYPQAGFAAGNAMDSSDLFFSRMPLIARAYDFSNLGGPDGFFGFQIEGNEIISARGRRKHIHNIIIAIYLPCQFDYHTISLLKLSCIGICGHFFTCKFCNHVYL